MLRVPDNIRVRGHSAYNHHPLLPKSERRASRLPMILIALGANLPDRENNSPLATCLRAVTALGSLPGYSLVAVSRWYETAPVPPSGQPPYVNGVVRMAGPAE